MGTPSETKSAPAKRRASGDGGNRISSPMGTPYETKSAPMKRRASGDGGNRTRVRKTRPSKIYERSRLRLSPQVTQPAKLTCGQPLEPEGPLSRVQRRRARHSTIVTPIPFTGWSTGRVDAASLGDRPFTLYCLRSEGHSGVGSAVGT